MTSTQASGIAQFNKIFILIPSIFDADTSEGQIFRPIQACEPQQLIVAFNIMGRITVTK